MSDDKPVDELIGAVYDAALDEGLWAALAPKIAGTFNSHSVALQTRQPSQGGVDILSVTPNFEAFRMSEYQAYYWERDLWVERAAKLGMSNVLASKDLIPDKEFERSEYYQDWVRRFDIFYMVGAVIPVSEDQVAVLGIHRTRRAGTYDEADKSLVAKFLPHLRRALQVRGRLALPALERQAAFEVVERSASATLVVSRDGAITYANSQAEELLRTTRAIRVIGGRLATAHRPATERLTALIRGAADAAAGRGGSPGGAVAIPRDDRLPLTILVAPMRPARNGFGAPMPAAILFIRDPEQPTAAALALQDLFGLTPAEANIASVLADGKSIDEIATALGVSLNTARTHIKNVYAKTGTNRQSQLVALLLRSVAVMAKS